MCAGFALWRSCFFEPSVRWENLPSIHCWITGCGLACAVLEHIAKQTCLIRIQEAGRCGFTLFRGEESLLFRGLAVVVCPSRLCLLSTGPVCSQPPSGDISLVALWAGDAIQPAEVQEWVFVESEAYLQLPVQPSLTVYAVLVSRAHAFLGRRVGPSRTAYAIRCTTVRVLHKKKHVTWILCASGRDCLC